jgi:hypothetical protein
MKDYFEEDMSEALRALTSWSAAHGADFARVWHEAYRRSDQEAVALDKARRQVKAFFDRAVRLFEANLVSKTAFHEIAYTHGLNVYYDVVVPLEYELNPTRRKRTDEALMREIGRFPGRPATGLNVLNWAPSNEPLQTDGASRRG